MPINTYAAKTTSLAGVPLNVTFDQVTKHEWEFVGYEITFPSAYTGTLTFTKIVKDTTNESDKPYITESIGGVIYDSIFSKNEPIFIASAGDTMTIISSANITGIVEWKVYVNEYPDGVGKRLV